jgi:hypothetical protein
MNLFKKLTFLSTLIINILMFSSCESELDTSQETVNEIDLSMKVNNTNTSIPENFGNLHNYAMSNVLHNKDNFNFNIDTTELKKQIIRENNIYLQEQISSLNIDLDSKVLDVFFTEDYSLKLFNTKKLLSINFGDRFNENSFSIEKSNINEKIEFIHNSNVISEFDKNTLMNLFDHYKDNINGIITDEELISESNKLKQDYYREIGSNEEKHMVALSIIEIATSSLDWSNDNLEVILDPEYETNAIPGVAAIAGADAVGAVVGVAEAIIESAIVNGTNVPVDGETVVIGAVFGAVGSSLGAAAKVADWIGKASKYLGWFD